MAVSHQECSAEQSKPLYMARLTPFAQGDFLLKLTSLLFRFLPSTYPQEQKPLTRCLGMPVVQVRGKSHAGFRGLKWDYAHSEVGEVYIIFVRVELSQMQNLGILSEFGGLFREFFGYKCRSVGVNAKQLPYDMIKLASQKVRITETGI